MTQSGSVYRLSDHAGSAVRSCVPQTFDGGYKPFNRKGISTNPSPLLKASYETTAAFLSDATLHGDFDDLTTPSGNIVMGRLSRTGTGVFDIVMPVDTAAGMA